MRAAFVLLALFHGFGVALYAVLWFVLPDKPGGRSGLDRVVGAVRALCGEVESAVSSREGQSDVTDAAGGDHAGGCTPTRN